MKNIKFYLFQLMAAISLIIALYGFGQIFLSDTPNIFFGFMSILCGVAGFVTYLNKNNYIQ